MSDNEENVKNNEQETLQDSEVTQVQTHHKYTNANQNSQQEPLERQTKQKGFVHRYIVQNDRPVLYIPFTLICLVIFIVVGVTTRAWHPAWVVFLGIPVLNWATSIFLHFYEKKLPKEKRTQMQSFPVVACVLIAFLLLGFVGNHWHPGWVVFLAIPIYYLLWNTFRQYGIRRRTQELEEQRRAQQAQEEEQPKQDEQ